jgi:hypothetical protein
LDGGGVAIHGRYPPESQDALIPSRCGVRMHGNKSPIPILGTTRAHQLQWYGELCIALAETCGHTRARQTLRALAADLLIEAQKERLLVRRRELEISDWDTITARSLSPGNERQADSDHVGYTSWTSSHLSHQAHPATRRPPCRALAEDGAPDTLVISRDFAPLAVEAARQPRLARGSRPRTSDKAL